MRGVEQVILVVLLLSPCASASPARCELCNSTLTELKVIYQDTETQDLISLVVDLVCEVVPIPDCVNYIDGYLNGISRTVLDLNPSEKCVSLGACPKDFQAATGLGKVKQCEVCATVADLIIDTLKNPDLEARVEAVLDRLCDLLSKSAQCKTMVHEYLTTAVQFITMENLNGHNLCDWIFFNVLGVDCNFF